MKIVLGLMLAFFLAACGADQATINRDTLGTSQTIIVAAQGEVLKYRARPPCTAVSTGPCRNNLVYGEMQRLDSAATAANNAGMKAIRENPSAPSTKLAVEAAIAAIKNFSAYVKGVQ